MNQEAFVPGADTLKRSSDRRAGFPSYARFRCEGGKNQRRGSASMASCVRCRETCDACTVAIESESSPRTIRAQSRSGQSKYGTRESHISSEDARAASRRASHSSGKDRRAASSALESIVSVALASNSCLHVGHEACPCSKSQTCPPTQSL